MHLRTFPPCEYIFQLLAQWIPQTILPLYDRHVDNMRNSCKNNAVNPTVKSNLRQWLLRTRRMYQAAGHSADWDKRSVVALTRVACRVCRRVLSAAHVCGDMLQLQGFYGAKRAWRRDLNLRLTRRDPMWCLCGRFAELTHSLRRKSSLSSVWADLGVPSGLGSVPATPHSQVDGGGVSGAPAVSTPAGGVGTQGSIPGTPA